MAKEMFTELSVTEGRRHRSWRFFCVATVCHGSVIRHVSVGATNATAVGRGVRWALRHSDKQVRVSRWYRGEMPHD